MEKAQAQLIEASKERLNGGIHLIETSKGRLDEKCI